MLANRNRALLGLVVALSFLGPAVAQAQDLDQKYKKADLLGSGSFKDVYTVEGHPELAIGIVNRSPQFQAFGADKIATMLEQEKSMLDRLDQAGIPAAKILEIGTYEGKKAYVQLRFLTGNRSPNWNTEKWNALNETTLADVQKIRDGLKAADLQVRDAQFLVGADGHVVFADPLAVYKNSEFPAEFPAAWKTGIPQATETALSTIEQAAKASIDARKIKALAAMPGAKDAAIAQYFTKSLLALAPNDAAGAEALKEALLHYLETDTTTETAKAVAAAVRAGDLTVSFFDNAAGQASNEVKVAIDGSFPKAAADLVAKGAAKLEKAASSLEADVVGLAHALRFLDAKEAPKNLDPNDVRGDPTALVNAAAAKNGAPLDDAGRAALVARANEVLGSRTASKTPGVSGLIDRRVDGATDPDRAVDGR